MANPIKYPRTPHLPWSRSLDEDDILCDGIFFNGKDVVVNEKLDGECTVLYNDYFHARSVNNRHHVSQSWIKALQAQIANKIPENWRVCGENVYAQHSISYNSLPSYFFVFGIYNDNNICISWNDTVTFCKEIGLKTVPVIYEGTYNEKIIKNFNKRLSFFGGCDIITGEECAEGYVIRSSSDFHYDDFCKNVAKYVRQNHVKTDEDWRRNFITNKLKKV